MTLNELQARLEQTYDVSTPHRVEDFLLHDAVLAATIAPEPAGEGCPERLLLTQSDDSVDVALYLDQAIVTRLARDNPAEALHGGNLQDFWHALEGVSHFLYLVWNTAYERPITQLELELQAEVDKFVTAATLLRQQHGSAASRPLRRILFEAIGFRDGLSAAQRERYQEANRLAARYCETLQRHFPLAPEDPGLRRELRRFYRMPQRAKIRHIESRRAEGAGA